MTQQMCEKLWTLPGLGFDVPASLASIEPNEPKIEASAIPEVALTV
jgi:hypothetical protein